MQTNLVRVLTRDEILQVVTSLQSSSLKSSPTNLMIFRLSCQCGLRRKEIAGLNIADVITTGPRPTITVRAETTKSDARGKRHRRQIPLWWDASTREAIHDWKLFRLQTADSRQPFICLGKRDHAGRRFNPKGLAKRWKTAIKTLGEDRTCQLSIHTGRRSYVSHCLTVGRSLAEVAAAVGHTNIGTTNQYTHLIESGNVPDIWNFVSQITE